MIRFDIENWDGTAICPCCGTDRNGNRWANCADAVRDFGTDQVKACEKYCGVKQHGYGDLCKRCDEMHEESADAR